MDDKNQPNKQTQNMLRGLEKAYEKLVKFKQYKNSPLVVAKDGVIVEIQPGEIPTTTTYTT